MMKTDSDGSLPSSIPHSIPLGVVFDKAIKSDQPHEIHELAVIYSKNPHFQNDREVWRTFLSRLKECSDDVERLRWLRFCLKALEKKDLEKIQKHRDDLNTLLKEIEKVEHLKRVFTELKNLPQMKLDQKITKEWLEYIINEEPGIAAVSFLSFTEADTVLTVLLEKWDESPKEKPKLLSLLIEGQKFGLWSMPKVKKNVRSLALKACEEKIEGGEELLRLIRLPQDKKVDPEVDEDGKSFFNIAVNGYSNQDVDHIAKDISLKSHLLYDQLNVRHLFHQAWEKNKGPTVVQFVQFINALTELVGESILAVKSNEEKGRLISFWIEVALHAFTMNDLNQPIAILAALDRVDIAHLKKAWEQVNPSLVMKKTALTELYLPFNNYKKMRHHIAALEDNNTGYIPFLGLYLKDLIFADEGNPSIVNDRINIEKIKLLVKTLGKIFRKRVQNEKEFIYHTRLIKTIEAYGTPSNRRYSTSC